MGFKLLAKRSIEGAGGGHLGLEDALAVGPCSHHHPGCTVDFFSRFLVTLVTLITLITSGFGVDSRPLGSSKSFVRHSSTLAALLPDGATIGQHKTIAFSPVSIRAQGVTKTQAMVIPCAKA